ncbi:MAG: type II toxin-antitoxin system RelE/ParE family toxin [Acidobacteriia bacterium]|nr:type II toxin-antitoxin system RelE/ParE family toxin [Terriglobia bacterium]
MDGLRDLFGRVQIEKRINKLRRGLVGEYTDVGDGLIELKIDVGPGYRVYCADDGANVLILCGGRKGTQEADITKAKRYWKEYKTRGQ